MSAGGGEETRTFLFMLTLPLASCQAVEAMPLRAQRAAKVRRLIHTNRLAILQALEATLLDQIENPRELEHLEIDVVNRTARTRARGVESVTKLPNPEDPTT